MDFAVRLMLLITAVHWLLAGRGRMVAYGEMTRTGGRGRAGDMSWVCAGGCFWEAEARPNTMGARYVFLPGESKKSGFER